MRIRSQSPEHDLVAVFFALAIATVLLDLILSSLKF